MLSSCLHTYPRREYLRRNQDDLGSRSGCGDIHSLSNCNRHWKGPFRPFLLDPLFLWILWTMDQRGSGQSLLMELQTLIRLFQIMLCAEVMYEGTMYEVTKRDCELTNICGTYDCQSYNTCAGDIWENQTISNTH